MTSYEQSRGTTSATRSHIRAQRHIPEVWMPHYVYRCFDATGRLIYVGCTWNPTQRITQHRRGAWWGHQIVTTRVTVFPDPIYALERERQAIAEEQPRWNLKGRWQHRALWTADDYRDHYLTIVMSGNATTSYNVARLERVRRESRQRYGIDVTDVVA